MIKCIRYELYKLLVIKKGYIVILGLAVYLAVSLLNNDVVLSAKGSDRNEVLLRQYYERWGGKLTPEKKEEIEAYKNLIDEVEQEMFSGNFERHELYEEKGAFRKFYDSYKYVSNNEDIAFISDNRGNSIMMAEYCHMNYVLLFVALIMAAVVFSADMSCGQFDVVKTTRLGNRTIIISKIVTLVLVAAFLPILQFVMCYIIFGSHFSMSDWNNMLGNIRFYKNVTDRSIAEVFYLNIILKSIGLFYCECVCAVLTLLTRKPESGVFVSFALTVIPYFIFNDNDAYAGYPFPTGLLSLTQYTTNLEKYTGVIVGDCVLVMFICAITCILYIHRRKGAKL